MKHLRSKAFSSIFLLRLSHSHLDWLFIWWIFPIQWFYDVHFLTIPFSLFYFFLVLSLDSAHLLPHSFPRDSQHFLATVMPCIVWRELYRRVKKENEKISHHRMKSIGFINYSLLCRCIIIIASSIWNSSHKSIEHRHCFFINPHFFFTSPTSRIFKFWFHFVCWFVGIVDKLRCLLTAFLSMKMMIFSNFYSKGAVYI